MQSIAHATGRPVEEFYDGSAAGAAERSAALLRAWDAIRTEAGQRRALAAVTAIADEEDHGMDGLSRPQQT